MSLGNEYKVSGEVKATNVENREHEPALYASRITEIPTNMGMRVAYDGSNNAEYVGYAPRGLAEGSDGWLLHKYTYDVNNNATKREIAYGNWTNRESESYS